MPDLLLDQEGAIATLTFNRPESRNALSPAMRTAITQALHALEMDDSVRCVVMKGAGELPTQTAQLAERLARGPTHAYGNTKRLLYRSLANDFEAQLQAEAEAEAFAECAAREDFKEGVSAFVEKRRAQFTGR
jgi:2-(1,2-epoxy-1,2-dihydrophenyl)acetyl-CoA isomerase